MAGEVERGRNSEWLQGGGRVAHSRGVTTENAFASAPRTEPSESDREDGGPGFRKDTLTATVTSRPEEASRDGVIGSTPGAPGPVFTVAANNTIQGRVIDDVNGDGGDELESGIPGVTIELFEDPNGNGLADDGGAPLMSTVTDGTGAYTFANIPDGDYTIVETDPLGAFSTNDVDGDPWDNMIGVSFLVGNETSSDKLFLDYGAFFTTIRGLVLNDTDKSDNFTPADFPLGGVLVELCADLDGNGAADPGDPLVMSAASDALGEYRFSGLPYRDYVVRETDLPYTTSQADADGEVFNSLNEVAVSVTEGSHPGKDFLDRGAGIYGQVRHDLDGDGDLNDPDPGVGGVSIQLYLDFNGDQQIDPSFDTLVATTATNPAGYYGFSALSDGNYVLVEVDPAGATSTNDADNDKLTPAGTDNVVGVDISGGNVSTGNDFLDTGVTVAALSGRVRDDLDGDGDLLDLDEGLAGVRVLLYTDPNEDGSRDDGTLLAQALTDTRGAYQLTNLVPGSYVLVEMDPFGSTSTNDKDDDPFSEAGTDNTIAVTLAGSGSTNNDFLDELAYISTVSGYVLNDDDFSNDDFLGWDDAPIGNVEVTLVGDLDGNRLADPGEPVLATTRTDGDGYYAFPLLTANDYVVVETDPAGAVSEDDVQGAYDDSMIGLSVDTFDVEYNDFLDDGITTRSISGVVSDGNGQPIPAVRIALRNSVGTVVGIAYTSGDGSYAFENAPEGIYTIVETDPLGTTGGRDADGGDPNVIAIDLAGADIPGNDFIDLTPTLAGISGTVYDDGPANNDTFDAEDTPVAAVGIELIADLDGNGVSGVGEPVVAGTLTAWDGSYRFSRIPSGKYVVIELSPGGFSDTDADGPANGKDNISVTLAGTDSTGNDFLDEGLAPRAIYGSVTSSGIPLKGVVLNLTTDLGEYIESTATDSNGAYNFPNLPDGFYQVHETDPPGTIGGSDADGPFNGDNTIDVSIFFSNSWNNDFSDILPVGSLHAIGGQVRDDNDADGNLATPTDRPIENVLITLYRDADGDGIPGGNEVVESTVTNRNGRYVFSEDTAGHYFVREEDPPVLSTSTASAGPDNGDFNLIPLLLGAADHLANDFLDAVEPSGYFYKSTTGEIIPGGNIAVNSTGLGAATVVQDGHNGQYSFTVDAGDTYSLAVTPPAGFMIDFDHPVAAPSYDPTGQADPQALGMPEDPRNPGFLTNPFTNPFREAFFKSVDKAFAVPGVDTLTYTLDVSHPGNDPLTLVQVADRVPAGTTFLSAGQGGTLGFDPVTSLTIPANRDARVESGNSDDNYGASNKDDGLKVKFDDKRTFIGFDLGSIPAAATITGGRLRINVDSEKAGETVHVHAVTQPWTEGTGDGDETFDGVSWNSRDGINDWTVGGGDYFSPAAATFIPAAKGYMEVDITALVQSWTANPSGNHGIVLIGTTGDESKYSTSESAKPPELVVDCSFGTAFPTDTVVWDLGSNVPGTPHRSEPLVLPIDTTKDARVESGNPDNNYGAKVGNGELQVKNGEKNTFLEFDLSALPAGATITEARVQINVDNEKPDDTVFIHPVTRDWVEGSGEGDETFDGVTWNSYDGTNPWTSPGGDYGPSAVASFVPAAKGLLEVDLTATAQGWHADPATNHGIVLVGTNGDESKYGTEGTANPPRLIVSYRLVETTTKLASGPAIVADGRTLTTKMVLTTDKETDLSSFNLVPNLPAGVTLTPVTSPATPVVVAADTPMVFTWEFTVSVDPGVLLTPDQIAFAGDALGTTTVGGIPVNWGAATSNSVIVTPPLTFTVSVDAPGTLPAIENTATIRDLNVIPPTASNTTVTALTGSIGDTVFADLDGNGVQDSGEWGIAGVEVSATNGTTTLSATTDARGYYLIAGLDSNGGLPWTVTVNAGMIPAGYSPTTPTTIDRTLATDLDQVDDADFGFRPPSANPYYLVFDLEPGDPRIINNNIPLLEIAIRSWPQFVSEFALGPAPDDQPVPDQNASGGNPDLDFLSNLLEYALDNDPATGATTNGGNFGVELIDPVTSQIDLVFTRPIETRDLIFTVQTKGALDGTWIDLLTIPAGLAAGAPLIVSPNGDGTETIRFPDIAHAPGSGLAPELGFVRLEISLDPDQDGIPEILADGTPVTDHTKTFGWQRSDFSTARTASFSHPFSNRPVFSGVIDDVFGSALNVATSSNNTPLTDLVGRNGSHYVQLTSGPREGERFDIESASVLFISLIDDPDIFSESDTINTLNTSSGIPTFSDLAGQSFMVLPHLTIDQLFDKNSNFAGLASGFPSRAAKLFFYNNRKDAPGFESYLLVDLGFAQRWIRSSDLATLSDQGSRTVDRCDGNYIHPTLGPVRNLFAIGMVADHDLACAFNDGYNLAGAPYPIDQTPTGPGGRDLTIANGFAGGVTPTEASQLHFWMGDFEADQASTYLEGYDSYMQLDGGGMQRWIDATDPLVTDLGALLIFESHRAATIRSRPGATVEPHTYPVPSP